MSFDNGNRKTFGVLEQLAALGDRSKGAPKTVALFEPIPGTPLVNYATANLSPGLYLVSAINGMADNYRFGEWPRRAGYPQHYTLVNKRVVINVKPGIYALQMVDSSFLSWGGGFVVGQAQGFTWLAASLEESNCEFMLNYVTSRGTIIEVKTGEVIECYGSQGTEAFHLTKVSDYLDTIYGAVWMRNVSAPDHSWHSPLAAPQGELLMPDGVQRVIRVGVGETVELYCERPGQSFTVVNFVPIGYALRSGERD